MPRVDLTHMKLGGQISVITTSDVPFIGVSLSETINLPVNDIGRGFTCYKKSEAVQRDYQRCATVATSKRAIKLFEILGHSKKVRGCGAVFGGGGTF